MKKLVTFICLLSVSTLALAGLLVPLLSGVSATGAGTSVNMSQYPNRWYQATLNGASSVSATVEVDGSTDNTNWVPIVTITLPNSITGAKTDAVATVQTAPYVRGNLIAISGVGATVTLTGGQ
jgi:hypothetical protein